MLDDQLPHALHGLLNPDNDAMMLIRRRIREHVADKRARRSHDTALSHRPQHQREDQDATAST